MWHLPRSPWRTRFAPAPTGYLHLGHVVNALFVWGLARAFGGRVLLRVEDHDRIRSRPAYEAALLDDLDWLGLAPDEGATVEYRAGTHPLRQSDRRCRYAEILAELDRRRLAYPCTCSRKEIQARTDGRRRDELWYPGTCRDRNVDPLATPIRRLRLDPEAIRFDDLRLGPQRQVPAEQCGDLLLRDRDGHWSYQLAVVVDDWDQGIDVVIRGEDLLASTGRQIQLARLLGRPEPPRFLHHALVRDADGRKLSKSDGDTGIRELRAAGWSAEAVLGEAAHRAGLLTRARELTLEEAAEMFAAESP